jgi:sulfatase modifying factor 1
MRGARASWLFVGLLAGWAGLASTAARAEGLTSYRFAVVVETTGLPANVKARLETAAEALIGELRGAECVARDDVRGALADARTETNQKCASGKLDNRCQIALGKGVDANYVARLGVQRQGKSCDMTLQVFSISEESQKASASDLGTSCDSDALTKGLRPLVERVGDKLGLGGGSTGFDLPGGAKGASESDFDRQMKALEARRAQEEATWTALVKELPKLSESAQRSKLEAYVKLVGPDGPHADEARAKLAAFREDEASAKLVGLKRLLGAAGTSLADKRRLVASFASEYGGTRAESEAQSLLSSAEERASAEQAERDRKVSKEQEEKERKAASASGRGGVTWIRSARAGVSFTKSEVTVAEYAACVSAGTCSDHHLDGYEWPGQAFTRDGGCNWSQRGPRGDHPMNCVDWEQASKFCGWLGGRLPTEDEWYAEASARGKYPWGNEEASCSHAVMVDGGLGCGRNSTWPVCSKPSGNSASGLCDMSGNVWEWTSTQSGAERVLRGGGWGLGARAYLSAAGRSASAPSNRDSGIGFRCARPRE